MYSEAEWQGLKKQQSRRWTALGVLAAVLLAGSLFFFLRRQEVLTILLTVLTGAVLIFGYELLIHPIRSEAALMDQLLHGTTHQVEGIYLGRTDDISLVDGVRVFSLTLQEDRPEEKEPIERLFYFDLEKEFPKLEAGTPVRVTYHDRFVGNIESL